MVSLSRQPLINFKELIVPPAESGLPKLLVQIVLDKSVERLDVGQFPTRLLKDPKASTHTPVEILHGLEGELLVLETEVAKTVKVSAELFKKPLTIKNPFKVGQALAINHLPEFKGTLVIDAIIGKRIFVKSEGQFVTQKDLSYKQPNEGK